MNIINPSERESSLATDRDSNVLGSLANRSLANNSLANASLANANSFANDSLARGSLPNMELTADKFSIVDNKNK